MRPGPDISAFGAFSDVAAFLDECSSPKDQSESWQAMLAAVKAAQNSGVPLHESIQKRVERLQRIRPLQWNQTSQGVPSAVTAVAPTVGNVVRSKPRYFRAVVWNLENFTHDPRPAGTQPIDSARNQARIAIAADFAFRMGADALLLMETGGDVGQAMSRLARRWHEKEANSADPVKRSVEPLVSPSTHALPELQIQYPAAVYPANPDTVRALMLVGEGYQIVPQGLPAMTAEKLQAALKLLTETSNNFQTFQSRPPLSNNLDEMLVGWAIWCFEGFVQATSGEGVGEDIRFLQNQLHSAVNMRQQFLSQPETELGGLQWAISAAREVVETSESPSIQAGVAEVTQLLLMAWILHKGLGSLEEQPQIQRQGSTIFGALPPTLLPCQWPIWLNGYGDSADLVSMSLFAGAAHPLILSAHDQTNGAIFTASDGELLISGLLRLGLVAKPHAETYGVVYRPYSPGHLSAFFDQGFQDLGYSTEGIYGILHGDRTGKLAVSQQPGHVLAGRAALKIEFPICAEVWVSFVVHHNRYSGSKEINTLDPAYVKSENTVLARLRTIEDEARLLASSNDPPLIVGDFNLPSPYVQEEPKTKGNQKGKIKRAQLRELHRVQMNSAGYFRRGKPDGTHPRTTLKRGVNIAKGELFSEPYDAVYQPFDLLFGELTVRSAAVADWRAFFPPSLMQEPVSFAGENNSVVNATVGALVLQQIVRTYQGIVRFINVPLREADPWISMNQGSFSFDPGAWVGMRKKMWHYLEARTKNFEQQLSQDLYAQFAVPQDPLVSTAGAWIGQVASVVDAQKKQKAKAQREAKKQKDQNQQKQKPIVPVMALGIDDTEQDDDFADLLDEEDDEPEEAPARKGRRKPAPEKRVAEMGGLFTALSNLEQQAGLRFWAAYGALVSDHLPIVVELADVL